MPAETLESYCLECREITKWELRKMKIIKYCDEQGMQLYKCTKCGVYSPKGKK